MLKQALQYRERGWPVVPCHPNSKVARFKWAEYQERLPDTETIKRWFEYSKGSNIALITGKLSGIVVVDIDPRHGGSLEGHTATAMVETPNGGWHLYYTHPGGHIPNSAGLHGPGIDVRGDGGYVLLPPSEIDGKRYHGRPGGVSMCRLPNRFLSTPKTEAPKEGPSVASLLDSGAMEGGRNDAIAKVAGQFARNAMPIDTAMVSLLAWNKSSFKPPLPETEVVTTVQSIYATQKRRNPVQEHRTIELAGRTTGDFDVVDFNTYMADNAPTEAQWLLPGWLLRETIALLVAPPESYKTWLEFDMAVSIAGGLPFLNGIKPASTGPVLIIQQEDHPGQNVERLSAIQATREGIPAPTIYPDGQIAITFPGDLPILFHPDAKLRFDDPKAMAGLDKVLAQYRPALCVIDPLYSATKGTDDYMASTVQKMLVLKQMREAYGTSFVIGHHTSKAGAKDRGRARGWGSVFLDGFLEQYIHVWKITKGHIIVRRESKREGPEPTCEVKLDICTKDPDVRYRVECDEITEEEAEELINPTKEGVVKAKAAPQLSPLAQNLLKYIRAAGPQDIEALSQGTGHKIGPATAAAEELVRKHRAFKPAGSDKYTVAL